MSIEGGRDVDEATPRPWRWLMDSGDVMLWGASGDPGGEGHVLTPHVCKACADRGAPCLGPTKADEVLIVEAVNAYDRLRAIEAAARYYIAAHDAPRVDADDDLVSEETVARATLRAALSDLSDTPKGA